jgi:large conductance mechanosensitive channel
MKNFITEFKEFAMKGSMLDLAVGIIIGTAFNKVISSLVSDILLPPLGFFLNKVNFSNLFVTLSTQKFATLEAAKTAGVPIISYGMFLDALIGFLITAFAVFMVIKQMNKLRRSKPAEAAAPTTKHCQFCASEISVKATRCPHCTSELRSA